MKIHCPNCHYEGEPKIRRASVALWITWTGATIISCFLFLPLLLIFIPMLFWILHKKPKKTCPKCGWEDQKNLGSPRSPDTLRFHGPGEYRFEIVGESHYQSALNKICGGKTQEGHNKKCLVTLICDNDNPYDKNAVRIEIEGMLVGHLKREDAVYYRNKLNQMKYSEIQVTCPALIIGGWDRGKNDQGHFGVKLDLPLYTQWELDLK